VFGHHNDVIAQDQKRDADVPLPDDALHALTAPPAQASTTDNPEPPRTAPEPPVIKPSIDGMSSVPATPSLSGPMQFATTADPGHPLPTTTIANDAASAPTNDKTILDEDQGTELSDKGADNPSTPAYLDNIGPAPEPEKMPEPAPQQEVAEAVEEPAEPAADENALEAAPAEEAPAEDETPQLQTREEETEEAPAEPASVRPKAANADSDTLLALKQQALEHLSPLVGELELPPVEKFRTLMMLIQSSDDKELLPDAYAAAQNIQDKHVRAQALLDFVNEVNYFTADSVKK
jgi:hypothetical protein